MGIQIVVLESMYIWRHKRTQPFDRLLSVLIILPLDFHFLAFNHDGLPGLFTLSFQFD